MRVLAILTAVLLIFGAQGAHAANLTPDLVKQFVNSLSDTQQLADRMKQEGKDKVLEAQINLAEESRFTPYSQGVMAMAKQFPADYKKLAAIVEQHNFSSPENWAGVGDNVIRAYIALDMRDSSRGLQRLKQQVENPEVKKGIDPAMLERMEKMVQVLETIENTPQTSIDAVAPYKQKLDSYLRPKPPPPSPPVNSTPPQQ